VHSDMNGYRKKSDTDGDSDEYLTKITRKWHKGADIKAARSFSLESAEKERMTLSERFLS